ncbi:MAG: hypothetical protein WC833_00420 [Bacteroidales bacterium]|jgi:hypothetical protein
MTVFLGASLKDLGKRLFTFSVLDFDVTEILKKFEDNMINPIKTGFYHEDVMHRRRKDSDTALRCRNWNNNLEMKNDIISLCQELK